MVLYTLELYTWYILIYEWSLGGGKGLAFDSQLLLLRNEGRNELPTKVRKHEKKTITHHTSHITQRAPTRKKT